MRMITIIGLSFLALAAVVSLAGIFYLRTALPQFDGTVLVKGLSSEVRINRDSHGIPHIEAKSLADATYALGYVHAQDRLWQMEMNRRIGAGRLSEIMGSSTLAKDKFLRTVGFYRAAEATFARLNDETQQLLKAYSAGVNGYLEGRSGALPPEYILMGFEPAKWTTTDSLVWMKMMSWNLSKNMWKEIERMRLMQILSPDQMQEFLPAYPGDDNPPLPDFANLYQSSNLDVKNLLAALPEPLPEGAGSNNWVVNGEHTKSGHPLLANDPHLGLAAPSLWYFAHLKTPSINAIGATLPGLPGITLGRNEHIAWGYTNTGSDAQDVYLEQIKADDPSQYRTPDGWAQFETHNEIIQIKDAEPVTITVRTTRHGPVISDVLSKDVRGEIQENMVLALAWTGLHKDDLTPNSAAPMMRAKNWDEFKDAIRSFTSPQQNMVYADIQGNIGYYAPALLPIRSAQNKALGRVPVPGWLAEYDWQGFIPFEELPHVYNPASGQHLTANQKIVADDYPHFITFDWATPYRARRIAERLEQEEQHSVQTFIDIQSDVYSKMAEEFLVILQTTKPEDERARKALTELSIWDGRMKTQTSAPLIFNGWMRFLNKAIYADELKDSFSRSWTQRPQFLLNVLTNRNRMSHWCDDITTNAAETCADILQTSLRQALDDLTVRYGGDMDDWKWGEAHFAHSDHLPFSHITPLNYLFDIKVPSMGDTFTVNVGRHNISDEKQPFANLHAASIRTIFDFSDLDKSLYIHSTGQSGIFFSPQYRDMAEDWAQMKYRQMSTKPQDYMERAMGTLTLKPDWMTAN